MRRPRQDDARPVLSYENMLVNELIREYLEVVIANWRVMVGLSHRTVARTAGSLTSTGTRCQSSYQVRAQPR